MFGQPVWLASVSWRQRGSIVNTAHWGLKRERGEQLLRQALGQLGDQRRERLFRMNVTLCLHRAMTGAEVASLPAYFADDPAIDLAGGPVEVLWESESGAPSTRPCAEPVRAVTDWRRPDLWVPMDCGACQSCQARTKAVQVFSTEGS